jgi:histone H3/H4
MTRERYLSYKGVQNAIRELDADRVGTDAIELLQRAAEDQLLARDGSGETEEIAEEVAVALTQMTLRGSVSRGLAREIWQRVCSAGPPTQHSEPPAPIPADAPVASAG